jgi:hypothetical protein
MSDWNIGDRVRIPTVKPPMRQPNPQHEGKEGTITGVEPTAFRDIKFDVPVITLDDGSVVRGYECWWEPVERRRKN